jgi:HSP20 family protein
MNLVATNPWNTISTLHDEFNRAIRNGNRAVDETSKRLATTRDWLPAVDIEELAERYIISLDVPGVAPEAIEVTLEEGVLTVKGERGEARKLDEKGFHRLERRTGSFYRRFALPDNIDASQVSAKGEHGVLEIVVPKQEKPPAKRITVK